jgi:AraC family transcriptional regulator
MGGECFVGVSAFGRVLHERAKAFHWSGQGSMSIKSFYNGTAQYRLNSGTAIVDSQRYLLLNHQQPYSITIDSQSEVESFCVFFSPELMKRTAFEYVSPEVKALDHPMFHPVETLELVDQTYWHDDLVTPALLSLRKGFQTFGSDPLWLDEQLHRLLRTVMMLHTDTLTRMNKISSRRSSTRQELFRRVSVARDVIMEQFRETLTLETLSQWAMLSPNHLIRTYKQAFGVTPHQHVVRLRLDEAGRLLRTSKLSISDICAVVGFESLGSFSAVFRRETGLSPLQYRKLGDF